MKRDKFSACFTPTLLYYYVHKQVLRNYITVTPFLSSVFYTSKTRTELKNSGIAWRGSRVRESTNRVKRRVSSADSALIGDFRPANGRNFSRGCDKRAALNGWGRLGRFSSFQSSRFSVWGTWALLLRDFTPGEIALFPENNTMYDKETR